MENKKSISMPKLVPVPIETKGLSWFQAIKVWWGSTREWDLAEDWHFTLPNGKVVVIPKGYRFNGASVPKIFRWLVSPNGVLLVQSLLHDFGYDYDYLWVRKPDGTYIKDAIRPYDTGRQEVWDMVFKAVGDHVNGMTWLNTVAYWALRFGGKAAWRACRSARKRDVSPTGHTAS